MFSQTLLFYVCVIFSCYGNKVIKTSFFFLFLPLWRKEI